MSTDTRPSSIPITSRRTCARVPALSSLHNALTWSEINTKKPKTSLESMAHPRNVGWGEIGLDYHYDNSPRDIQRQVFLRQLRHAVRLGKPVTVHTREAEVDTERILKAEVPKDHKVRYHHNSSAPIC